MLEENTLKDGFYHFAPIYTPCQGNPLNTATYTPHTLKLRITIIHHLFRTPCFWCPVIILAIAVCMTHKPWAKHHFILFVGFRKQIALEYNSVFVLHVTAYSCG
jgi:hypothetical protein